MNVQAIINTTADDADEFLAGISTMTEARAAIREHLKARHPELTPDESTRATAGILAILEEEGFFDGTAGAESFDDGDSGGGSDDEP